jgi:hypothetical protein
MSGERILTLYGGIGLFETDGETGVNTNLSAFQLPDGTTLAGKEVYRIAQEHHISPSSLVDVLSGGLTVRVPATEDASFKK